MMNRILKNPFTFGAGTFSILVGIGIFTSGVQAAVITNGCTDVNNSCTLSELFGGATIQVGDKVFSNWDEITNNDQDDNPVVDPSDIGITGIFQDTNAPGIKFTDLNNTLDVQDSTLRFIFDFKVTSLGPKIKDNTLTIREGQFDFSPLSIIDIGEEIGTTKGGNDLGTKNIQPTSVPPTLEDSQVFEPQQEIWVRKDIFLLAGFENDFADITMFEQRFSQVPEPSSILGILTLGTLGAASTLKRKLKPFQSTEKGLEKVS